jgi:hypothetical protein
MSHLCHHYDFVADASCDQASRIIPFPYSGAEMDGAQPVLAKLGILFSFISQSKLTICSKFVHLL